MKIATNNLNLNNILQNKNHLISTKNEDFVINLERKIIEGISQEELSTKQQTITQENQNEEVEKFKNDLTKYGATGFWLKFNLEKIQKILDEKRQELSESLGLNKDAHPPLTEEQKYQASQELEKLMSDFTKELLEKNTKQEKVLDQQDKKSLLANLLQ